MIGRVKRFRYKRYAFITSDGRDYYYSKPQYRHGQYVYFEAEKVTKGWVARNVRPVKKPPMEGIDG